MAKKSILDTIVNMGADSLHNYLESFKKSTVSNSTLNTNKGKTTLFGKDVRAMRETWGEDLENLQAQYGFKMKLTLLTDHHKTMMYLKNPIIAAIVQTRSAQISMFSRPSDNLKKEGFSWVKRDRSLMTKDELATIQMLNKFILNCGIVDRERERAGELTTFDYWLKTTIKDSLIYDNLATELVYDFDGKIHHWLPVAGDTIRLAAPNLSDAYILDQYNTRPKEHLDEEALAEGRYKYVQIVNQNIRRALTADQLIYEFRNPVNNLFTNGYPVTELDLLMNVISTHLNLDTHNRSLFTNGMTAPGIVNLKGEIDEEQLEGLRRAWYSQGIGIDSMFKTPLINAPEGIEFIKLDMSAKDYEFSNLSNYLIKLMCAIYLIAPEEIYFQSSSRPDGSAGNSQNYSNAEKKIEQSMDKGLKPILRFYEDIINNKIMPRFGRAIHEKYEFVFTGIGEDDEMSEVARLEKESRIYKTVNEIRVEKGLDPIEGADFLLEPNFMNWYQSMSPVGEAFNDRQDQKMQEQQAQQDVGSDQAPAETEEGGEQEPQEDEGQEVQYVDEDGNPIDPEDIDPDSMSFTDENGNPVDHEGKPIDNTTLPFEEDTNNNPDNKLPFEEGTEKEKLPFES